MTLLTLFLILLGSVVFTAAAMAYALHVPVRSHARGLRASSAPELIRRPSPDPRKRSRSVSRPAVGSRRLYASPAKAD